jgi:phosphatidylinositol alpha-1,6-mannosyltransferase
MRILIPTIDYPPIEGGISTVCLRLARELASRGHDVTVLAPWFPDTDGFDRAEPYTVARFKGYGLGVLRFFPLLEAMRGRDADVVLAINIAYGGIAAWLLGRRYLSFAYAYEFLKFQRVPPLRGLLLRVYVGAVGTVAISEFTSGSLAAFGVAERSITVAYPGADAPAPRDEPRIAALRQSLGLGAGPLVLSVGRFIPRKNHRALVEAWPRVLESVPGAQLVMAGRGPERDACIARAQALGVAHAVHCPGYLDDADIAQLYHACDLFALPNGEDGSGHVEGFGLVFAEAAACGKPSIAGGSGGAREAVLHGETGLLVNARDTDAVAEALITLLSDALLRERMGTAARERVEHELNWQRFTDGVLKAAGCADA